MRLRARVWPGLRTRSIVLECVVAAVSLVSIGITAGQPDLREAVTAPVVVTGSAVLALLLLGLRRRAPLVPFLVAAVLAALSQAVWLAIPFTSYAMGRYVGRWPQRVLAAAVGVLVVLEPWSPTPPGEFVGRALAAAVVVLLPGAVGAWFRTRDLLLTALRERAERAEAERELLARDAVLVERTRIAREMHDAVGHRVSLMVLQAGAIEMAAGDRDRVEQLSGQVQAAGRQALDELRQMVGVLRAGEVDEAAPLGPQPGLADLPRLVAQSREAGMAVSLSGRPDGPVDPAVGRAAYRIVQEALTNAGKHAPGAPVTVTVERTAHALTVRVLNGPGAPADRAPSGGFGLVGLGERVRTLGGTLTAEPRLDGGFTVEAVLPT